MTLDLLIRKLKICTKKHKQMKRGEIRPFPIIRILVHIIIGLSCTFRQRNTPAIKKRIYKDWNSPGNMTGYK
jgi:hypothetical protein